VRSKPRIYVTRHLPGGALDYLAEHVELKVWPGHVPPPREELVQSATGCDGLLTLLTDQIDAALLDSAPGLLVVSNMATGFDNIAVVAATRHCVLVARTPGVLAETTAEFAFALMIAAGRKLVEADRLVRHGLWRTWGPETLLGRDLEGSTLGIVGMGGVGRELALRARAFGMRILYHSRTRREALERRLQMSHTSLDQLLRESDFVSLHAPLTPQTRGLIAARELTLMKASAVLVNTARGSLVDQGALYEALVSGTIAAAAIDVTDPEPMAATDPLLKLENVIVTPHIASASIATRSRMAMLAAQNLVEALNGRVPKHAVNREISRRWRAGWRRRFSPP